MKLTLSEEQALIESSVRDFLAAEYSFARRRRSLHAPHGCAPEIWQQFAAMGWLALPLAERDGGTGGGMLEAGLVMRAFGRHLVLEPYAASALLAAPLLARQGRPEQRDRWLGELVGGRARAALAHEELGAPLPWLERCTVARRSAAGWLLSGSKQLVPGAAGAELLLLSAQVPQQDGKGQRLFLLPPDTKGLRITSARAADGSHAADLVLDDVLLSDNDLLGADVDATPILLESCARHLVALCWEASGAMAAVHEQTVDYLRQRVQFGQPLSQLQVVAHRLAEMAVCCEEAHAACELAALCIDAGSPDPMSLASLAKSKVGRESRYVAQQAVQLHGAMGVSEELPVASYFRKLTAFGQQGGSHAAHSRAFGAAMLHKQGWRDSRTLGA